MEVASEGEMEGNLEGGPMNAIRIRKKLDSDTLHLPQLRPLVGQNVEIIVLAEEAVPGIQPGTGDWTAFDRLAREVTDYDFDAQPEQDQADMRDVNDHRP